MGCSPTKIKYYILFDFVLTDLYVLEIQEIDTIFDDIRPLILDVERLRINVVIKWGKLITHSGAIVLKKPRFLSVLKGFYYLIARDITANPFNLAQIQKDSPHIEFKETLVEEVPEFIRNLKEKIVEYAEFMKNTINDLNMMKTFISEFLSKLEKDMPSFLGYLKKFVDNDMEKYEILIDQIKYNKYCVIKLLNLVNLLLEMRKNVEEDKDFFLDPPKDVESRLKFTQLLKQIHSHRKNKKFDDKRFYYHYSDEKKLRRVEDWFNIYTMINVEDMEIDVVFHPQNNSISYNGGKKESDYPKIKNDQSTFRLDDSKNDLIKKFEDSSPAIPERKKTDENKIVQIQLASLPKEIQNLKKDDPNFKNLFKEQKDTIIPIASQSKLYALKSWNICLLKSFSIRSQSNFAKSFCNITDIDSIAIGTKSGEIEVYKTNVWTLNFILKNHENTIKALCYLNDGLSLVSGCKNGKIFKWDLLTQKNTPFEPVFLDPIKSIIKSLRSNTIMVASGSKIYFYNTVTCKLDPDSTITFDSPIEKLLLLDQNKYLIIGFSNGGINVYNLEKKSIINEYKDHTSKIRDLMIYSNDNNLYFVSCSKDKTFKVYDPNLTSSVRTFSISNKTSFAARAGVYCNDEKTMITIHDDGKIFLNNITVDAAPGYHSNKYYFSSDDKLTCALYCGDGSTLIIGNNKGNIDIFFAK